MIANMRGLHAFAAIGVPAMVVIFGVTLSLITLFYAIQARTDAIDDARSELELISLAIASDINATTSARGAGSGTLFEKDLPGRIVRNDRMVFVAAANGSIVGSLPSATVKVDSLTALFGLGHPLTIFNDNTAVMQITLPDGREALATARELKAPLGKVAVVQPLDTLLAPWRAQTQRNAGGIAAVIALMGAIAAAYFWQARRAQHSTDECTRIGARMDSALTHGRCGLWEWDIARGKLHFSKSMYEILGMEPRVEPLSIGDVTDMLHPEDNDLRSMAQSLLARDTDVIDHVFRIRSASGEWVWLHARAELDTSRKRSGDHLIGIALDITERKMLEEQTQAANTRLADAIDTISEAFVLWNRDKKLVVCNSKYLDFLSLPAHADFSGQHYDAIMAQASPPQVDYESGTGPKQADGRYEARLTDGRWMQISERRTADGGIVSVGTDITELKRNESQLRDAARALKRTIDDLRESRETLEVQARELSQLAEMYHEQKHEAELASRAKSAFLGNMSHELFTPLNAIIGFSEVMEQQTFGGLGSPKYVDYSSYIRNSGEHLLRIISDVLEMSTLDAGKVTLERAEVELGGVIQAVAREFEASAQVKGQRLAVIATDSVRATADRQAVEKVLTRLLRNAVKFTPEGGAVSIRLSASGSFARIYVEDTGPGIRAEDLERLGKPFEQINSPLLDGIKGAGLGLAIARSLAELQGGSLQIRSAPGEGTSVCVELPLAAQRTGAAQAA